MAVSLGLAIVLGTAVVTLFSQEAMPGFDNKYSIGQSMNYTNKKIEMTEVKPIMAYLTPAGCTKYPPQQLNYTVDKSSGTIVIKESVLKAWHPRDYDASLTKTLTSAQ